MTAFSRLTKRWILSGVLSATSVTAIFISPSLGADGAPIPETPPFASPDIKPTLRDFLTARPIALKKKIARTDPLQRPPFVGQPPDSLKGMAAGVRSVQLDVPNRIRAVRYLGTLDCVTYPQAQAMLIDTMQNDPSEEVRYEAVMALRMMLSRGCGNMDSQCECESCSNRKKIVRESERLSKKGERLLIKDAKGKAKKEARQAKRLADKEDERYDCCRGCCNPKALNALSKVAFDKDEQCCFVEPSERVRKAAEEGLCLCCSSPYMGEPIEPSSESPEPIEEKKDLEASPSDDEEAPAEKEKVESDSKESDKSEKSDKSAKAAANPLV